MNTKTITTIAVVVIGAVGLWYFTSRQETSAPTDNPPNRASIEGLIAVDSPLPDAVIASPLNVSGQARGNWYFEASFPVRLIDANGAEVALDPPFIMTEEDWMTEEYAAFKAMLSFEPPATETGTLILEKDNPSGLPENSAELRIPVRFVPLAIGPEVPDDSSGGTTTNGAAVIDSPPAGGATLPPNPAPSQNTMNLKLYYYNPDLDQGPGGTKCSEAGLVAVNRSVPTTITPLRAVIELLLKGELTEAEKAQGINTEFPLPGLALTNAAIANGTATLTFIDPQNNTSGGACRATVLWHQIEATAKQFPTVDSARFMPEDLFQP